MMAMRFVHLVAVFVIYFPITDARGSVMQSQRRRRRSGTVTPGDDQKSGQSNCDIDKKVMSELLGMQKDLRTAREEIKELQSTKDELRSAKEEIKELQSAEKDAKVWTEMFWKELIAMKEFAGNLSQAIERRAE